MQKFKKGVVDSCKFTGEWLNPINKKVIYYHEVCVSNGDLAICGAMEKNSSRIAVGATIEYEIDEKGKMKLSSSSNDAKNNIDDSKKSNTRIKGQEAFLGYAWSYAKDFVITGKTMKDVDELNKVARFIYNEIGKMLNNE